MLVVKLDERILRDFKIGVFIGLRKSNRGVHTAFFINGKESEMADLLSLTARFEELPGQLRRAYGDILAAQAKEKKGKRRKKNN